MFYGRPIHQKWRSVRTCTPLISILSLKFSIDPSTPHCDGAISYVLREKYYKLPGTALRNSEPYSPNGPAFTPMPKKFTMRCVMGSYLTATLVFQCQWAVPLTLLRQRCAMLICGCGSNITIPISDLIFFSNQTMTTVKISARRLTLPSR
ncbi:hypothetical protein D3C76_1339470 [compost metagenome]